MPPHFELSPTTPSDLDAVVVGAASDRLATIGDDLGDPPPITPAFLASQGFDGKVGAVVDVPGRVGFPDIVVVGMGPSSGIDPSVVRRAAADACRAARRRRAVGIRLLDGLPEGVALTAAAQALAEGAALGSYRFDRYKSQPLEDELQRVVVVSGGGEPVRAAIDRGARIAEAIALARDLVNMPGGDLTPQALAEVAVEIAERENLQITVMDEDDIVEAGLGGLLGVNRGSNNPPRFIELCYEAPDAEGSVALVGKGITFDSGGLSIKTGEGMMTMKMDMGGAAAVLGAFSALAAVDPRCSVRGYLPITDNMSGGDATRPGDVLEIRNGKTVEVLNTDAEGRLVLADALSLACEAEPDAVVDVATLTGAVETALGSRIAGLMGNRTDWTEQVSAAASRAGERVWELPLPDDYRGELDSEVADLRNISKSKKGGTILAGLFLREFVREGTPWAHLDIAGTAWWEGQAEGEFTDGGTGWGVRTLLELVSAFERPNRT
jgi:leucyl aminopeptidase